MAEGPNIALEGIGKSFDGGPPALEDISLTAQSGEIVAIVGPSGCGKTTLLRIIAGLLEPSTGEVLHSGNAIHPAYIFQDATLLPWATVEDNIALPARLQGQSPYKRRKLARYWAERVGLEGVLTYYPRQLSGGMKMRVSIARALSQSPNLLLLDEPFGALDAITRNRLNEELLSLHGQSRWTAFFVTHSVTEAVFLSHRVVILSNQPGRVAAVIENTLPTPRDAATRESLEFQHRLAEANARLQESLDA